MIVQYSIVIILLFAMSFISVGIISSKELIGSVILTSIFSFFAMMVYSILKAPDVAITEAAVGSAISTLFAMMLIMAIGKRVDKWSIIYGDPNEPVNYIWIAKFCISMCFFVAMVMVAGHFPEFGDSISKANLGVGSFYSKNAHDVFGIENIVTAILGGYRGFDTMIEVTVTFTASLAVYSILKRL